MALDQGHADAEPARRLRHGEPAERADRQVPVGFAAASGPYRSRPVPSGTPVLADRQHMQGTGVVRVVLDVLGDALFADEDLLAHREARLTVRGVLGHPHHVPVAPRRRGPVPRPVRAAHA